MRAVLLIALAGQVASGQAPASFDAGRAALSTTVMIAEIDAGAIKGDMVELAWSGDNTTLYLRTAQYDRWRNESARHYLVAAGGGALKPADGRPAWAAAYWVWKSGTAAPGVPDMKFDTDAQTQMATAVGSVRDAGLSQSRGDPSQSQVASDYSSAQQVATVTIKLKGMVIAEATNSTVLPGRSWSWSPAPLGGLAYVNPKKRLVLVDRTGKTIDVPGAVDVLLPAWSPDGKRLAYLQKKNKKTYTLNVVEVDVR